MKPLCAIALSLAPALALAAGYGGAEGRNRLGERIHIASDMGEELFVIRGRGDGVWSQPFQMKAECPAFDAAMWQNSGTFSCPAGRQFPLSGTTYRIGTSRNHRPCATEPFSDPSPGTVYRCIKGCENQRAPALFKVSPWEC